MGHGGSEHAGRLARAAPAAYAGRVSRSNGRPALLPALLLLLVSGAAVLAATAACGSFDATAAPPAEGDASIDGQALDAAGADAAAADGAVDAGATGCRGAFMTPRTISTVDSGIGKSLRSVRGVTNGTFLISYDTSPDDDMATAKLPATGFELVAPDALSALNGPSDESAPTAPSDLNFVLFVSDRAPAADGGTALFISEFAGTAFKAPEILTVGGVDPLAGGKISNPYLVDNRVYFDVDNRLQSGELFKTARKVSSVGGLLGLATGTHPVVSKDQNEIFFAIGAGIQFASRPTGLAFKEVLVIPDTIGDYPTWISDDSCHLYAIHNNAGAELRVFDRAR